MADGGQDTSHALRTRLTDQDTQGTDQKTHGPRKGMKRSNAGGINYYVFILPKGL